MVQMGFHKCGYNQSCMVTCCTRVVTKRALTVPTFVGTAIIITVWYFLHGGWQGELMVSTLISRSSGPIDLSWGYCFVFLGKTLQGIESPLDRGQGRQKYCQSLCATETRKSSGLVGHFACMHTSLVLLLRANLHGTIFVACDKRTT